MIQKSYFFNVTGEDIQANTDAAVSLLSPLPLVPLEEVAELAGHLLGGVASIIQIPDSGQQR